MSNPLANPLARNKDPRVMTKHQTMPLIGGIVSLVLGIIIARAALSPAGSSASMLVLMISLFVLGSSLITKMMERLGDAQVFPFFSRMHGDRTIAWNGLFSITFALCVLSALASDSTFWAVVMASMSAMIYTLFSLYQRYSEKRRQYESLAADDESSSSRPLT